MEKFNPKMLNHVLRRIFSGTPEDRIVEIEQILNATQVFMAEHLLIMNTIQLKKDGRCTKNEIEKIENHIKYNNKEHFKEIEKDLQKIRTLKQVLIHIFCKTPVHRLEEIEKILNKEEIYSGMDIAFVNTSTLRKMKSLSEIEIKKIEDYIKQNNEEMYEHMHAENHYKDEMKAMDLKLKSSAFEQHFQSLKDEKALLLEKVSHLETVLLKKTETLAYLENNRGYFSGSSW